MARHLFVINAVQDQDGNALLGKVGAAYATQAAATSQTSPLTDLQNAAGQPITSLVTDQQFGSCVFYGPEAAPGSDVDAVWLNFGFGPEYLQSADLHSRIVALEAEVAALQANTAAVIEYSQLAPTDHTHVWIPTPSP